MVWPAADRQRMVAVGVGSLRGRDQPVALDLADRRAHRGRHRRQAGLAARFGVHRVDFGHQALPLGGVVLSLGFIRHEKPQDQPG